MAGGRGVVPRRDVYMETRWRFKVIRAQYTSLCRPRDEVPRIEEGGGPGAGSRRVGRSRHSAWPWRDARHYGPVGSRFLTFCLHGYCLPLYPAGEWGEVENAALSGRLPREIFDL